MKVIFKTLWKRENKERLFFVLLQHHLLHHFFCPATGDGRMSCSLPLPNDFLWIHARSVSSNLAVGWLSHFRQALALGFSPSERGRAGKAADKARADLCLCSPVCRGVRQRQQLYERKRKRKELRKGGDKEKLLCNRSHWTNMQVCEQLRQNAQRQED